MKVYPILSIVISCFSLSLYSQDSVIISASTQYEDPNLIKRILVGKNYREVWAMPVQMKVFDIDKEKGGLKITELGGGQQTKSLRMKDKKGTEWVLRTVDKDVNGALPPILRKTFMKKIVQDQISSAYPYAPLAVGYLAKTLELAAPDPELFYIPDDTRFGEHRKLFANAVCMLEKTEPTFDGSEAWDTDKLYDELKKKPDNRVDGLMLLKARLLDMLIGDWDRHKLQWKWGKQKKDDNDVYYPVPRDRDQAFFQSNGLLVKLVRPFTLKHMVGFTDNDRKLTKLSKKAWSFDKQLLNELDAEQWKLVISNFQKTLNDDVLDKAIKRMPPEVVARDGAVIMNKLKKRRDGMMEYGMKYYKFLSREVKLMGTEQDDIYKVTAAGDGIKITATDDKGKKVRWQRTFNADETRKIHINLLKGADQFIVDEKVNSDIKVSLTEDEKDTVKLNGKLKVSREKEKKKEKKEEKKEK
ncbi:MAG TPA: hypothetical protein VM101_15965 [Flavitalea sp.]|nr:hypothetical protein [Flavitalea sp.]